MGLSNRIDGELADGTVTVHGAQLPTLGAPLPDGPVVAYIRPEDVSFAPTGIPATVLTSSFLGSLRRTRVQLADGAELAVQHAVGDSYTTGDVVHVRFGTSAVAVRPRD